METERKLLVICGPTATGKTALGVKLARKFNGEIVSADSRQVYIGMDIGTGKDLPKSSILQPKTGLHPVKGFTIGYYLFDRIPMWLLDVVTPDYRFSVADYVKCANLVIDDILERAKSPILVGGTGFYIKGVVDGIETLGVPPDWELRKQLSELPVEQLREILERIYPERMRRMNESDRNNPRRLIRVIEIARYKSTSKEGGTPPKARGDTSEVKGSVLFIGLTVPNKILYQRIGKRVDERVKRGIIDEIKKLLDAGFRWNNSVLGGTIGYREWQRFFEKKSTLEEVVQKWKFAEHSFARRQLTWFKKNKRVNWFDITGHNYETEIEKLIDKWYNE